jgi:hypothetical protein
MEYRSDILAEIHRLIDKQAEALRGKLTEAEGAEYAKRRHQIESLIEMLHLPPPTRDLRVQKEIAEPDGASRGHARHLNCGLEGAIPLLRN